MAWGARQHEDGTWRICERKGRTILTARGKPVVFKGRASCERCAKELNEAWWDAFVKAKKAKEIDVTVESGILEIIHKHGGIKTEDFKELT